MGCLSFHPRKIVTTGEGGAVTTDDAELADAVRRLRHHGIAPSGDFDIAEPGLNYRLADMLCAVGIPQLERLQQLLAARERVAGWYTERLEHLVDTPSAAEGDRHGWQAYVVHSTGGRRRCRRFGRTGSRRRSARTRCTTSPPIATAAGSPAPTALSHGRSRFRSRRR